MSWLSDKLPRSGPNVANHNFTLLLSSSYFSYKNRAPPLGLSVYNPKNPYHLWAVMAVFLGAMSAICYIASALIENRGRFRIGTILALMSSVAVAMVAGGLLLRSLE